MAARMQQGEQSKQKAEPERPADSKPVAETDAASEAGGLDAQQILLLIVPGLSAAATMAAFARIDTSPMILTLGLLSSVLAGAAAVFALAPGPAQPPTEAPPPPAPPPPPTISGEEVLRRLPAPLILLDSQGRIVFANTAAEGEIGRSLVEQHYSSALRAPGVIDAVNRAYLENESSEFEFSLRGANERHLRAFVEPLSTGPAEPTSSRDHRILILIEDHTRARRAEQLHRDFVANASHELKTPLASISGFIETLRGPAKGDEAAHERFLAIMAQQADRMRYLVEDLLSLNRIELNEHIPPRDAIDLRTVLEDAAALAEPDAKEGEGRIRLQTPESPPVVIGDPPELTQVFANLMSNALKYGGDGKPVDVVQASALPGETRYGVSVVDHGAGIAREHLPRLTERFYRVDVPASRDKGGTGLGLAIVKHILNRHRGELEIESELGRGSRFTVWLPLQPGAESRREPGSPDANAGRETVSS